MAIKADHNPAHPANPENLDSDSVGISGFHDPVYLANPVNPDRQWRK